MKRTICLIAIAAIAVGLVGCNSEEKAPESANPTTAGTAGQGKPGAPAPSSAPTPTPGEGGDAQVGTKAGG